MRSFRRGAAARVTAAVVGLVAAVTLLTSSALTTAAFTDEEHARPAQELSTFVLEPPRIVSVSCSRPALLNLGGTILTVQWTWPSTEPPYASLGAEAAVWRFDNSVAEGTTTGPVAGVYTTTFTAGLLERLVGSIATLLLGSSYTASVTTTWSPADTTVWESPDRKEIAVVIPPLIGSRCPNPDA